VTEYRSILERAGSNAPPADLELESILRRRDRKRRKQRIAAGVVGIAVFVAAVWIVTGGLSPGRSQNSVVPGGDVTGPAETGPTETGPAETGPVERKPVSTAHLTGIGFVIPPEDASPSTPERGNIALQKGNTLYVYEDGRVIWWQQGVPGRFEQRLTPEGVNLLRSRAVDLGFPGVGLGSSGVPSGYDPGLGLPESAWEDPEIKPYVAARFAVCYAYRGPEEAPVPSTILNMLPGSAQAVLRGAGAMYEGTGSIPIPCRDVSTQDARTLDAIFREVGDRDELKEVFFSFNAPNPMSGQVYVWMMPLLPHMDDARDWDQPE
jgi:hypothetical protein